MSSSARLIQQTTLFLAFLLLSGGALLRPTRAQAAKRKTKTYEFTNGNWFDGKTFKRRAFYSVNGFLTDKNRRGQMKRLI